MDERIRNAYTIVINKYHSAVQTDTLLEHTDNWKLEKKAKQFWDEFREADEAFKALLERCTVV